MALWTRSIWQRNWLLSSGSRPYLAPAAEQARAVRERERRAARVVRRRALALEARPPLGRLAVPAAQPVPTVTRRRPRMVVLASPVRRAAPSQAWAVQPTAVGATIRDQRVAPAASARTARGRSQRRAILARWLRSRRPAPTRPRRQARVAQIRCCSAGTRTVPFALVALAKVAPSTQSVAPSIRQPGRA